MMQMDVWYDLMVLKMTESPANEELLQSAGRTHEKAELDDRHAAPAGGRPSTSSAFAPRPAS
jgi:hypothetical protein